MAAIQTEINDARRRGVKRQKKSLPRIDMTPMVDLGFLLITFFIITAELSKPVVMKLNMPAEGPPMQLGKSNAMTILLADDDQAWYYEGEWQHALVNKLVFKTDLNSPQGLRSVILDKKKVLAESGTAEGSSGLMLLIKAGEKANYKNVIDILDEVTINDIKKYAIVEIDDAEMLWLSQHD